MYISLISLVHKKLQVASGSDISFLEGITNSSFSSNWLRFPCRSFTERLTELFLDSVPVSFLTYLLNFLIISLFQFSSVAQSCPTLCDPMNCSTPGLPVHHQLLEFTQTRVHRVNDAIQPSHPLLSPSPSAFNLFQHQGLFHWVSSSHQVAKVLEFQLQHQSFQWTPRTDLL